MRSIFIPWEKVLLHSAAFSDYQERYYALHIPFRSMELQHGYQQVALTGFEGVYFSLMVGGA